MFTGIVEALGQVVQPPPRLLVRCAAVLEGTAVGDSINVNGACLTVVQVQGDAFAADVVPETLRRTNLGALRPGDVVNLERAVSPAGRLGGHIVQGHVDGTGRLLAVRPAGQGQELRIQPPARLLPYIVEKGFIAVDGTSLTVAERTARAFSVAIIPYTLHHTNLHTRRPGDRVNLEVDILAKYVESLLRPTGR